MKNTKIKGGVALGIIILTYIISAAINQTIHLNYYAKYTIGEITSESGHLIKKIIYRYSVNGIEYKRGENYQGGEIGKLYFVKYSYKDPTISDFLQDSPVPNNMLNISDTIWNTLPRTNN